MLARCRRVGTRHAHTRRELPYPIEGGLGKFLPPEALQTLAEYQDGLLARLDDELLSTSLHSYPSTYSLYSRTCFFFLLV